jgi:hypothetical protein
VTYLSIVSSSLGQVLEVVLRDRRLPRLQERPRSILRERGLGQVADLVLKRLHEVVPLIVVGLVEGSARSAGVELMTSSGPSNLRRWQSVGSAERPTLPGMSEGEGSSRAELGSKARWRTDLEGRQRGQRQRSERVVG